MARAVFQRDAEQWIAQGRPAAGLVTDPQRLLVLHCWCGNRGVKENGGAGEAIEEHHRASWAAMEAQSPDWYEILLSEHLRCADCGETYRLENLSVCCGCLRKTCWCVVGAERLNGNPLCPVCHDEIVG